MGGTDSWRVLKENQSLTLEKPRFLSGSNLALDGFDWAGSSPNN